MNQELIRTAVIDVLEEHAIDAFSGSEVACACDHFWQSNRAYRMHVAEEVAAAVEAATE